MKAFNSIKKSRILKKFLFLILTILLVFFLIYFSFSCRILSLKDSGFSEAEEGSLNKNSIEYGNIIIVGASIIPIGEFVKRVGGNKVEVVVMVPEGTDPHTYEPSPKQLRDLDKALIYVKVGSGIDFELFLMDKISEINRDMIIVDCSNGIEMLNDPHIWLSPRNVGIIVDNIYDGLIKIDAKNSNEYKINRDLFYNELKRLDKDIIEILKDKKNRSFIIYHPALSYFARDYNLNQIAIEFEGKEPTAKSLADLIDEAKRLHIKVVFASPQFSTKSAEVIAKEIGGNVILIDPLACDYIQNMRKIAEALDLYLE